MNIIPHSLAFCVVLNNRGWISTGHAQHIYESIFGGGLARRAVWQSLTRLVSAGFVKSRSKVKLLPNAQDRNMWRISPKGEAELVRVLASLPGIVYLKPVRLQPMTQNGCSAAKRHA